MKFWQVDAFTKTPFKGNPAAVFVLEDEISDELMQNIAIEMNLAETAFILLRSNQNPLIRWFTTDGEIDLCGHATLASSHIYLTEFFPEKNSVTFDTKTVGSLSVDKHDGGYQMSFPIRAGEAVDIKELPTDLLSGFSHHLPLEAFKARDLMLVYENEAIIKEMNPDLKAVLAYDSPIIVTSLTSMPDYDFISRFFWASAEAQEDPVTGSSHCTLMPYWSKRLKKEELTAWQASPRGGKLDLILTNDNVMITGDTVTVFKGEMCL